MIWNLPHICIFFFGGFLCGVAKKREKKGVIDIHILIDNECFGLFQVMMVCFRKWFWQPIKFRFVLKLTFGTFHYFDASSPVLITCVVIEGCSLVKRFLSKSFVIVFIRGRSYAGVNIVIFIFEYKYARKIIFFNTNMFVEIE